MGILLVFFFAGCSAYDYGIQSSSAPLVNNPIEDAFVTNGRVNTIQVDSKQGVTYIGGAFTNVGPYSGHGVLLDPSSSETGLATLSPGLGLKTYPKIHGEVYAVASDGAGGFYIGGYFDRVGGISQRNLAHIFSSGKLDTQFNLGTNIGGQVKALVFYAGHLYVGGNFSTISSVTAYNLAAINTETLAVVDLPDPDGVVNCLTLNGNQLYVGGAFGNLGGVSRSRIAALDISNPLSATVDTFFDAQIGGGTVNAIVTNGSQLFVGGSFTTIAMSSTNPLVAVDFNGDLDSSFQLTLAGNPESISGQVYALAISSTHLYIGGDIFTSYSRFLETNLLGEITYAPILTDPVHSILISGDRVFVAGSFDRFDSVNRKGFVAFDQSDHSILPMNPEFNDTVRALALSGNRLFAGGAFTSVGASGRKNIAALNNADFSVNAFNPSINGEVSVIHLAENDIFVGGNFTQAGGSVRSSLAAFNRANGALRTGFDVAISGTVLSLASDATRLYLGGDFGLVQGTARTNLASVSLNTAALDTSFIPNPDGRVLALAIDASTLYIGGEFLKFGASTQIGLAAWDLVTDTRHTFVPLASTAQVHTLMINDGKIYVGGGFTTIGGSSRKNLASFYLSDRTLTSFNPTAASMSGSVLALQAWGGRIFVGGESGMGLRYFSADGDYQGNLFSSADSVRALAEFKDNLLIGGGHTQFMGAGSSHFNVFDLQQNAARFYRSLFAN